MHTSIALSTAVALFSLSTLHTMTVSGKPTTLESKTNRLDRRQDAYSKCTDNDIDPEPGFLLCVAGDGTTFSCDDCFGLTGDAPVSYSDDGATCFITTEDSAVGSRTSCPGDPPPETK